MAKHKFVSAAKPTDYADQLHDVQQQMAKLEAQMKLLKTEERQLSTYLVRFSKGTSFVYYAADGYKKVVKVGHRSRLILDQAKVQKILKSKTPYKPSEWATVAVDWVYE